MRRPAGGRLARISLWEWALCTASFDFIKPGYMPAGPAGATAGNHQDFLALGFPARNGNLVCANKGQLRHNNFHNHIRIEEIRLLDS